MINQTKSSSKKSSKKSSKMFSKMHSNVYFPSPKSTFLVEREKNGETLVFNVQEVSPWLPKIRSGISHDNNKIETKNQSPQALTCSPHEDLLCGSPSMEEFLSVLNKDEITACSDNSCETCEGKREGKDEFVLSWGKSDGTNESIIVHIEDQDWLL